MLAKVNERLSYRVGKSRKFKVAHPGDIVADLPRKSVSRLVREGKIEVVEEEGGDIADGIQAQ